MSSEERLECRHPARRSQGILARIVAEKRVKDDGEPQAKMPELRLLGQRCCQDARYELIQSYIRAVMPELIKLSQTGSP